MTLLLPKLEGEEGDWAVLGRSWLRQKGFWSSSGLTLLSFMTSADSDSYVPLFSAGAM